MADWMPKGTFAGWPGRMRRAGIIFNSFVENDTDWSEWSNVREETVRRQAFSQGCCLRETASMPIEGMGGGGM